MLDTREMGTAAPRMAGPEVLMPQESKAEVDQAFAKVHEMNTVEAAMFKVFLQGMEYQRTLTAAALAPRA